MNVSTMRARSIVTELLGAGVRHVALAPGSRSAPLALALAAAERAGLLRLHVRLDERSAAYCALGAAKVLRAPAAVVTTSGTAAVNLHPAVTEAAYAGVPLIAITADRPAALRATGANQTIDQVRLFGTTPRWYAEVDLDDEASVRTVVARAVAVATDPLDPGPVHLNVPFPMPLVPDDPWSPQPVPHRQIRLPRATSLDQINLDDHIDPDHFDGDAMERGLIIVGEHNDAAVPDLVRDLSAATGWPVISEPSGGCSAVPGALHYGSLLLSDRGLRSRLAPSIVVTVGQVGLSRAVSEVVAGAALHVAVDPRSAARLADPTRSARLVLPRVPGARPRRSAVPGSDSAAGGADSGRWATAWAAADARARQVVTGLVDGPLSGPVVARCVAAAARPSDLVVVGPSWPIRHLANVGGPLNARVVANRGTSGIDGVVSTAWGAAVAHHETTGGATICLLGDLTALYDRNGLLSGAGEAHPPLTYVVVDNNGGGIFSALEQGAPRFAEDFERVFGTPHAGDCRVLLSAPGVEVLGVDTVEALQDLLADRPAGVRVAVVQCSDRASEQALLAELHSRVTDVGQEQH